MRIAIVGAGIGGLTAALALRRADHEVHVYEQARVLREVGAGVAISPNAVRVLHHIGLADALARVAVAPISMDSRDWHSGDLLGRVPLGEAAVERWGAPFYHLHRADLHDALRAALGDAHLTLGARCTSVAERDGAVEIRFADGREAVADVVVGADGVHSVVRDYVAGPDRAVWSRQVSWRGLAPASAGEALDLERRHHSFWGPHKQFVAFFVSSGRFVNWVGNTQSEEDWLAESWSARGERDEVLALFADWHPQVRGLIAATESVYQWALFDRPPLSSWTRGRVTLLGDAAHPMLPYMAQGASQSIEDACALARCLTVHRHAPAAGIEAYAAGRMDRTARVQGASREASRTVRLMDPAEVEARNARLRESPEAPIARFDWIWSHDEVGAKTLEPVRSLLGSLNHVSITVRDLDDAMRFFGPFLAFLGYDLVESLRDPNGQRLHVNANRHNGAVLNVWEAKPELAAHPFEVYEVGLHHIAFNTDTREQVDEACALVTRLGARVLDGPADFPYDPQGWYAVYFLGPDGLKFEVVHQPSKVRAWRAKR
jgi:salicylate hydroxylase